MNKDSSNMRSDNKLLSDLNAYRYTLMISDLCVDFVFRDDKIVYGYDLMQHAVSNNKEVAKIRCDMDNFFTHCVCRIRPYSQSNCKLATEGKDFLIIQNQDRQYNEMSRRVPNYNSDSSIWSEYDTQLTQLTEMIDAHRRNSSK